jgi:hypothetical protein
MFFEQVKQQWIAGNVHVGLPALGYGNESRVSIEASGLTSLAVFFLSEAEKQRIVEMARNDANNMRDAGERPIIVRADLVLRLQRYSVIETSQALEILAESDSEWLTLEDVRRVWDRVSVALDHHSSGINSLSDLELLENELSTAGRYGPAED